MQVIDPAAVDGRCAAHESVHLVALVEQQLREVGAVLSGDPGDECTLRHGGTVSSRLMHLVVDAVVVRTGSVTIVLQHLVDAWAERVSRGPDHRPVRAGRPELPAAEASVAPRCSRPAAVPSVPLWLRSVAVRRAARRLGADGVLSAVPASGLLGSKAPRGRDPLRPAVRAAAPPVLATHPDRPPDLMALEPARRRRHLLHLRPDPRRPATAPPGSRRPRGHRGARLGPRARVAARGGGRSDGRARTRSRSVTTATRTPTQ